VELIKIAHPKFREELEKAGRERGLIKKKIFSVEGRKNKRHQPVDASCHFTSVS